MRTLRCFFVCVSQSQIGTRAESFPPYVVGVSFGVMLGIGVAICCCSVQSCRCYSPFM